MKNKVPPASLIQATTDPAALARQATTDSAIAMREGRYADARALAALADSYHRMADRLPAAAFEDDRLDAAGEEALRQDLLKRLDALAAEIAAQEDEEAASDPFTPAPEPAISPP
ncbi:hypothetical protein [Brevundimonas lenta]|uniref:Uncharacterized protein n=1 Tax=Brevundimonas lenta TaxID=424796 RepID=A0A7W6JGN7_9CAUL|nr:hypothetical protein [Brevundimonas lenta]MBB4083757.1 hypothetical protein [Brevundimonas lenta]